MVICENQSKSVNLAQCYVAQGKKMLKSGSWKIFCI